MKKAAAITLILLLTLGLCACGLGGKKNKTPETESTTPPVTTEPMITNPVTEPSIIDPTMETNIPDPNVDDEHLVDPTGDGIVDNAVRGITKRIKGLS